MNESFRGRARELVESSFVVSLAELPRSGAHPDRLLLDPRELTSAVIDEWVQAGVRLAVCITFSLDRDVSVGVTRQLERWRAAVAAHVDRLVFVEGVADLANARETKRIGVMVNMHLGEHLASVADVDRFFALGQRSCIVVNGEPNQIGYAAHNPNDGGLSELGRAIVGRMNEVGMAIDISHASEQTSKDILATSTSPVLLSHSNPRVLSPSLKNKSDEVLCGVAKAGGVIGVGAVRYGVGVARDVGVADYVGHIDYLCGLVGAEHVALGFEMPVQGYDRMARGHVPEYPSWAPKGDRLDLDDFNDIDRYTTIAATLLERGHGEKDVRGILGANAERTLIHILRRTA